MVATLWNENLFNNATLNLSLAAWVNLYFLDTYNNLISRKNSKCTSIIVHYNIGRKSSTSTMWTLPQNYKIISYKDWKLLFNYVIVREKGNTYLKNTIKSTKKTRYYSLKSTERLRITLKLWHIIDQILEYYCSIIIK